MIEKFFFLKKKKSPVIKKTVEEIVKEGVINRKLLIHRLINESIIGGDFYFLLIVSTLIITMGLLINNIAIVVGGMMIAPILSPMLALGLIIVTGDWHSFFHRLGNILKVIVFVLLISYLASVSIGVNLPLNNLIRALFRVDVIYFYIAILSGFAATYTWIKPKFSVALPGVAIAVAILPPLCVTGIGLALFNKTIIINSLILFLLNLIGIVLSSAIVFALFGFTTLRKVEERDVRKEEKLEKEKSVI